MIDVVRTAEHEIQTDVEKPPRLALFGSLRVEELK